jgi:hypothetical protein
MAAIDAPRISARDEKERRRSIDDDAADVLRLRGPTALVDLEPQSEQVRGLGPQARRLLLALASLREAQGGRAIPPKVHGNSSLLFLRSSARGPRDAAELRGQAQARPTPDAIDKPNPHGDSPATSVRPAMPMSMPNSRISYAVQRQLLDGAPQGRLATGDA